MTFPVEIWLFKDAPRVGVRVTVPLKSRDVQGRAAKYVTARGAGVDAALTALVAKLTADTDIEVSDFAEDLETPPDMPDS